MNFSKSQYILIILFFVIAILSYPIGDNGEQLLSFGVFKYSLYPYSELNILEVGQAALLCFSIYETIKIRKLFLRKYNLLSFFFRVILLIFLLYEEISFLTMGKFEFTKYNSVNQLNIHNSLVGRQLILDNFQIPIFNYQFSLSYYVFFLIIGTLFIGFGGFLKILKKIKPLFLEKKYSFFFLVYIANIILRSIALRLNLIQSDTLLNNELIEFYLYFVFLIDTLFKKRSLQKPKIRKTFDKLTS